MLRASVSMIVMACLAPSPGAGEWQSVGPPGGDVRSLAADPNVPGRVYLGTANGTLYRSDDAGQSWRRPEPGFPAPGMSLDDLIVDARGRLLVGYWEVSGSGGGVAISDDGGQHFDVLDGVAGRAVRALSVSPSHPDVVVAGLTDGVLRSDDGGRHWRRISPEGHPDLRNVGSVSVDPTEPYTVYAGTWHLAWKTRDGGRTWVPIQAGMIDDSDVMTLTIDPRDRRRLHATACSGIYRTTDAGAHWTRLPGIPWSARRTRAFAQDPERPQRLYAGTVEGLWTSDDDAGTWQAASLRSLVVNALAALPGGIVLAGTDAAGVLRSTDRGASFHASNAGFAEHFVSRIVFDAQARPLVAVLGDRHHSGVHGMGDDGRWQRLAPGLEGHEVLSLTPGPPLVAGTDNGLFAWREGSGWERLQVRIDGTEPKPRVAGVVSVAGTIVAATNLGLLRGEGGERSWTLTRLGAAASVVALARLPDTGLVAATPLGLFRSSDTGGSWEPLGAGPGPAVRLLAATNDGTLLAGTERGLYGSPDGGRSWLPSNAPATAITDLAVHPDGRTVLVADFSREGVFRSSDGGHNFEPLPTRGLPLPRVWALGISPSAPHGLWAASPVGGLHRWQDSAATASTAAPPDAR